MKKNSASLASDKKIELTLLDDGNSDTGLPNNVVGNIAVSGNTATFTKSSEDSLASEQYLALVCKTAAGYHLIKAASTTGSTTTFDLSSVEGDIESMSVIVCKDNKSVSGDPAYIDEGGVQKDTYNVRYARNVSTTLKAKTALSGNVSISNVLSKANGYSMKAQYSEDDLIDGKDFSFQWYKGNNPISGATNATYYPKPEEYGEDLKVKVTGKRGYTGTKEAEATVKLNFNDAQILNPFIYADSSNKNKLADDIKVSFNGTVLPDSYVTVSSLNEAATKDFQTLNVNASTNTDSVWSGTGDNKPIMCYYEIAKASPTDISNEPVTIPGGPFTYDGKEQKPNNILVGSVNSDNYTVTYINNTNAGTATVIVDGNASKNYTGRAVGTFTIERADITCDDIDAQNYTGSEVCPTVTVKRESDAASLTEGEDYIVTYKNNIEAGIATAVITGIGNYKGTVEKNFTIDKAPILEIRNLKDMTYTGDNSRPTGFEVWCGSKISDPYDVTYKDAEGNNIDDETILSVGEYTMTVSYSGKTATAKFKVLSANISNDAIQGTIGEQDYTGNAICPSVEIAVNGKTLVKDRDYTVAYINNVEPGTATVIVTGKGNCIGSASTTFKISAKPKTSIEGASVSGKDAVVYNGSVQVPDIKLKLNNQDLVLNRDYIITHQVKADAKDYMITAKGIGEYTGEISINFTVNKAAISEALVLGIPDQVKTGKEIKPEVTVFYGGRILKAGTDYNVGYSNNTEVGTGKVTITPESANFTGSTSVPFKIVNPAEAVKGHTITYHVGFGENLKYSAEKEATVKAKLSNELQKAVEQKTDNNNILDANADINELPDLGLIEAAQNNRYVFLGWYYDSEYKMPAGAGAAISGNINLYAKWGLKGNLSGTGKICPEDQECYRWIISDAALLSKMSPYTWEEIKKVGIFKEANDIGTTDLGYTNALIKGNKVPENFWK